MKPSVLAGGAILVLLSILAFFAFTAQKSTRRPTGEPTPEQAVVDARVTKLFGGQEGLRPVLSPTKVEAFRIENRTFERNERPQPLGGYPVIAGPVPVDEALAADLSALLTDASTYDWELAKPCEFDPGVAVRFIGPHSTTEVIFCFECDELVIFRDNKRVGGEAFESVRGRFVAIMKRIFPNDGVIQSLE